MAKHFPEGATVSGSSGRPLEPSDEPVKPSGVAPGQGEAVPVPEPTAATPEPPGPKKRGPKPDLVKRALKEAAKAELERQRAVRPKKTFPGAQRGHGGYPALPGEPVRPPHVDVGQWISAVEAARRHTQAAVTTLARFMHSAKDEALRVHCAELLLNRGWGKPTLAVAITEAPKQLYGIDAPLRPVESPEAWLARRRQELSALTIEVKPIEEESIVSGSKTD